jgi:hypothetical protein
LDAVLTVRSFIIAGLLACLFAPGASAQLLTAHGGLGVLGGGGSYTLIAHTSAGSPDTFNVTTSAIDTTASGGADLIVVAVNYYAGGGATYTLSDSASNSWGTAFQSAQYTSGGAHGILDLYYIHSPTTSATHTFTVTAGAGAPYPTIAVQAWNGSAASPPDQYTGAGTTETNVTSIEPGSITPSQSNELLVCFFKAGPVLSGSPSIDSGFTSIDFFNSDGAHNGTTGSAYLVQGAASAVNPTWSWSSPAGEAAAVIASFK